MEAIRFACVRVIAPTVHYHRCGGSHVLWLRGAGGEILRTFSRHHHYHHRGVIPVTSISNVSNTQRRNTVHNHVLGSNSSAASHNNFAGHLVQFRCLSLTSVLQVAKPAEVQPSTASKGSASEDPSKKSKEPSAKDGTALSIKRSSEEVSSANASGADDLDSDDDMKDKSLFVRFKEYLKKYWYLMAPVHLVTSAMYIGAFYYLATLGLSPVPLLQYWGVPERYLETIAGSGFGELAVALAFYKIATPLRYLTTVGVCGVTVKQLRKRGLLRSSSQIQEIVKNKVKDIKEKRT